MSSYIFDPVVKKIVAISDVSFEKINIEFVTNFVANLIAILLFFLVGKLLFCFHI